MTLNLTMARQQHTDFSPRITVVGVGGAGCNAVNNMIAMGLDGVEFLVTNTDAQALVNSRAERRVQLGPHLTQGLGAGAKPEIGRAAAEEATEDLARHLEGVHMLFITAGMGGGTGTGAAPVIARMARERGVLTVGVVTKPFDFEGPKRRRAAETGLDELQANVDTLIVIPNQNLFRKANERTTFAEAFKMADDVLYMGVRGVTDLMMAPGIVNLDFADIRTVMAEMGKAMMGTGEAEGEDRAVKAAEAAISNPLLEDTSMRGARGVLINITGGWDMTLFEVDEAANRIRREVDEEANIIFGSSADETMNGRLRVSVVATGIDAEVDEDALLEPQKVVLMGGGAAASAVGTHHLSGGPAVMGAPVSRPSAPARLATSFVPPSASASGPAATAPTQAMPSPATAPPGPVRLPVRRAVLVGDAPAADASGTEADEPSPSAEPVLRGPSPQGRGPASPATPPAGGLNRLFRQATGLMKRQLPEEHSPGSTGRAEAAQPAARPVSQAESGLDIPAFLRRQKN